MLQLAILFDMNIYQKLPKPFFVLAPMDDVTDVVFRQIVAECAEPDLFVTEFVNADGFCSKGRGKVEEKLQHRKEEHSLVAQIWGLKPENFYQCAKELKNMGFVGIDINMGCPERKVVKRGACAALIANPTLASEIIIAVQEAVDGSLPVSVKTRIGFRENATEQWTNFLLGHNLDALTIHARTAAQMSKVPAQHEEFAKVVKLRDELAPSTAVIGNGDILTRQQGIEVANKYQLDGVMIGRGIFHNPYVFAKNQTNHTPHELISLMLKHINLHEKTWGSNKDYHALKRFFKVYVNSFDGALHLREKLMQTKSHQEARDLITAYLRSA